MKTKPYAAYLIGVSLILLAASFPIQISYWFDHDVLNEFTAISQKLTSLNYLAIIGLILAGIQTMTANLNRLTPIILFGIIGFNNYIVGKDGGLYSMLNTMTATIIFGLMLAIFVRSKLFKTLSDRKLQWWRSANRKRIQLPIKLAIHQLQREKWKTIDISSSGMFLRAENNEILTHPKLKIGSHFPVYLDNQTSPINVEIIRKQNNRNGRYNVGIGIRFINLKSHQKSMIAQMMS